MHCNILPFLSAIFLRLAAICVLLGVSLPGQAAALKPFSGQDSGLLFTLEGSNTLGAKLAPAWAKAYLQAKGAEGVLVQTLPAANEYRIAGTLGRQSVFIDVHAHGSSTGFEGLAAQTAQIAMSSRPIKTSEISTLSHLGNMTQASAEHVVGIDGLAIIVHPSNPITQLRLDQIAQIFAGALNNWQQLGGPDAPIHLHARDDHSGTFDTFQSLVLGKDYTLAESAQRFESSDALSAAVSQNPYAIGFVGLSALGQAKALAVSQGLGNPLKPAPLNVATEDYPLSRRLFLYTPPNSQGLVAEFVAFAHSQAGQALVEKTGFVSQNPVSLSQTPTAGPAPYLALAKQAKRLSVNFRFQPGQADLDNKALRDITRLAQFLNSPEAANLHVQLVGFDNSELNPKRGQILSRLRASAVKQALNRQGVTTESVLGFGDDILVASKTGSAAVKNERVEVWVFNAEQLAGVNALKAKTEGALVAGMVDTW